MKTYSLYKHPRLDIVEAVKVGLSWPAFFFNFFWMLIKRLWIQAGLYLMAGILLSNLDKIADKANSESLDTFMLISYSALLLVPGFLGNKWRDKNLRKQGYEFVDSIQAESPKAAIAQVTQSEHDLVPVFETFFQPDILVIKSALDAEGINYHFSGEFFHMAGVMPSPARLLVSSDQKDQVHGILKDLQFVD
jgi:hypothetical protein